MYIDVLTRVVVSLWEGSGLKVALNQQSHKVDTNVDTISHTAPQQYHASLK